MAEKQRYKALVGLNYPPGNLRAGPGSVVDDIPRMSLPWMLAGGYIVETTDPLNRINDIEMEFGAVVDAAPAAPVADAAPAAPAATEG